VVYRGAESPAAIGSGPAWSTSTFRESLLSRLSRRLCRRCRQGIYPITPPLCPACGVMFESRTGADHYCGDCLEDSRFFRRARAALLYQATVPELIRRFKYKGKLQLAAPFGAVLFLAFRKYWADDPVDLIIPVPLHPKRFRNRGFNQSYLLLRNWKQLLKQQGSQLQPASIATNVLVRVKSTAPQAGLNRRERVRNIQHAFKVQLPERVRSKRILLVDDIFTTGATIDECARILLGSGAERVDVLTLARAV